MRNLFPVVANPRSFKNSIFWVLLGLVITLWMMFAAFISSPICKSAHAFASLPSDYCLLTDIAFTYSGGGTVTNFPVRATWDTTSIVTETGLNETAWDMRSIIGSFSNEIFIEVQDINTTTTTFWAILQSISNGSTQTVRTYSGTNDLYRDSGVYFSGGELLTIADDSVLDTSGSGNLQIDLWMDNSDETPRNEVIFDKRDAANGYEIQFADVASVLMLQFEINNGSCNVAWDSAWTDNHNKFTFVYANNEAGLDAFIHVNDVVKASCDIDEGAVGNNILDLTIGGLSGGSSELTSTAIKTVTMFDNGVRLLKFTFDAIDITETVDTNPFEGTILDHSGNAFNAAYVYNRDQSNIAFSVGASQLVSTISSNQVIQEIAPINVLGDIIPFAPGFSVKTTDTFLYTWFVEPLEGVGSADWMGVTLAMTGIGFVIGIAFFLATNREFTPLSVFVTGMPISLSGAGGWTPWWYIFMWWALMIFVWYGVRRMSQSGG